MSNEIHAAMKEWDAEEEDGSNDFDAFFSGEGGDEIEGQGEVVARVQGPAVTSETISSIPPATLGSELSRTFPLPGPLPTFSDPASESIYYTNSYFSVQPSRAHGYKQHHDRTIRHHQKPKFSESRPELVSVPILGGTASILRAI